MFCWSKFGAEAGELAGRIVARKEYERVRNGSIFLWGIGNSIRPSLEVLIERCESPDVLFTPMHSRPLAADACPQEVLLWRRAYGIGGVPYPLPPYSVVTSRPLARGPSIRHFALVCAADESLQEASRSGLDFQANVVRNLRTGSEVGSSQVTSVVRHIPWASGSGRAYSVAFRAKLVYPYLVTLRNPVVVPPSLCQARRSTTDVESYWHDLLDLRDQQTVRPAAMTLF